MSDTIENELDYDTMSEDDLADFINKSNGEEVEERIEETSDNPGEENETEKLDNTTDTGSDNEDSEDSEEETDSESEYTKGKSRSELLKMIQNGSNKISQQHNEIHKYKQNLKEPSNQKTESKPQTTADLSDLESKYDKEDLDAIQKLVDQRLKAIDTEKPGCLLIKASVPSIGSMHQK